VGGIVRFLSNEFSGKATAVPAREVAPAYRSFIAIRVKDADFSAGHLLVRDTKGQKDRITLLPLRIRDIRFASISPLSRNSIAPTWRVGPAT
jgi:hypothetical protein